LTDATAGPDGAEREPLLQPWQFFLLGGMLAATATVIVATGQSPANIIILSLTVVSVSFVGLGAYRMLAPLVGARVEPPMTYGGRTRTALEREKNLVLRSIKELEFDFAMGKIAKADFDEMSARLRARAVGLMRQLDAGGYKEQIAREIAARLATEPAANVPADAAAASENCPACGTANDDDARFCKNCGTRLRPSGTSARQVDLLVWLLAAGLWLLPGASMARAQVNMPDPSAIAGTPLPAPELADGTVTVRVVRERMGNNVAGQEVVLIVGGARRTAITDEQGRAEFTKLPPGALVQASTTVDGEALVSQEFQAPGLGGIRVALIAGIAKAKAAEAAAAAEGARQPARPGVVEIGPESRIILEYQDDNLTVFYLFEIVNNARTPIDIGGPLLLRLPRGASGASMMQGSSPNAGVKGDLLTVTGPFPPGKTIAHVGFSLPQAGASLRLEQTFPIAVAQLFVGVEKIGNMQMTSPQLPETREMNSGESPFIMGQGGRLNAGDTLVLNLTGLPAQSHTSRNVVLALTVIMFLAAAWFAFAPSQANAVQDAKLIARREKLLNDIVAIERKRRQRPLSEAEDAKARRLTTELERVIAELDRGTAA